MIPGLNHISYTLQNTSTDKPISLSCVKTAIRRVLQ